MFLQTPDVLCGIGLTLVRQECCDRAAEYFSAAIESDPGYWHALMGRALVLTKLGRFPEAEADYTQLLEFELDPTTEADALVNRGLLIISSSSDSHNIAKALNDFLRAIALEPWRAAAHYGLGVCYQFLAENQLAIDSFSMALTLDNQNPSAYFNRGLTYYRLREYQRAIEDTKRALTLQPSSIYYQSLGDAQMRLGYHDEAVSSYGMAISLFMLGDSNPGIDRLLTPDC